MKEIDLAATSPRELNGALHAQAATLEDKDWHIVNPLGQHAIACGVDADLDITIDGHVGYYCAGMNKTAKILINGNAGVGLAENMMSGLVHVTGDASQSAGATGHGGLLVIDGNASARCGISLKGLDIVVKGNVGHMSAFMAQAGHMVVLGDTGEALGDSIYEAKIFVAGTVKSLGADCVEKPMGDDDRDFLVSLLADAGVEGVDADRFKLYGSARKLYHFKIDNIGAY